MNTKSLLTRIGVPVLSLGLLGGAGATLATSASAATLPGTVTAVTHEFNAPDTTSGGTVTSDPGSGNGPIWAYDNLAKQFKVTQTSPGHYTVVETVHGSFTAFSEPNTALNYDTPIHVTGSVDGTNTYYELSTVAPDPALLPSQEPAGTPTGDMISALFGGSATTDTSVIGFDGNPASGNLWVFTYHAGGSTMTQRYDTPANTWGNITGH
jgi:hypothetical protein